MIPYFSGRVIVQLFVAFVALSLFLLIAVVPTPFVGQMINTECGSFLASVIPLNWLFQVISSSDMGFISLPKYIM